MEAATVSSTAKSEFRNDSGGHAGAIVIENGKEKPISVAPGDSVVLNRQEQILTANSPKKSEDNPFINGTFTLVTAAAEMANRRAIGDPSLAPEGVPEPDSETVEKVEAKKAEAEARRAEEAQRLEDAKKQGAQGAQPRVARPPARSVGEGAGEAAQPEETAAKPEPSTTTGTRDADEEVAEPEEDGE